MKKDNLTIILKKEDVEEFVVYVSKDIGKRNWFWKSFENTYITNVQLTEKKITKLSHIISSFTSKTNKKIIQIDKQGYI